MRQEVNHVSKDRAGSLWGQGIGMDINVMGSG